MALHLTQTELAGLVGVDPSSIRNYETGRSTPRGPTLRALEGHLKIPLRDPPALMTEEHLSRMPNGFSEELWEQELRALYKSWLGIMRDQEEASGMLNPDMERTAAILARQSHLWAHGIIETPFGGGVTYRFDPDQGENGAWIPRMGDNAAERTK